MKLYAHSFVRLLIFWALAFAGAAEVNAQASGGRVVMDIPGYPVVFELNEGEDHTISRSYKGRSMERTIRLISVKHFAEDNLWFSGDLDSESYSKAEVVIEVSGKRVTLLHRPYESPRVVNGLRVYVETTKEWAENAAYADLRDVARTVRLSVCLEGEPWGPVGVLFPISDYRALIRPSGHNRNLQVLSGNGYFEGNENLSFSAPAEDRSEEVAKTLALKKEFEVDEASVIIQDYSGKFRLPKTSAAYDRPFAEGWPRGKRELESERYMLNAHGTFYEVPREAGYASMRAVATHKKKIVDYCTWRGLLVISGTNADATEDGHYFPFSENGGLWFGAIDDLWKLGKPVGEGGVWKDTDVRTNEPSLPYLMTGYDHKTIALSSDTDAVFTVEVDVDHNGWKVYEKFGVKAGQVVIHTFPDGFSAHWVRLTSNVGCKATGWLVYE